MTQSNTFETSYQRHSQERPEVTEKLFMIRRIYNEQQQRQRNEEASALLAESNNRSQEHEALVASAGEGGIQSGMDIDLDESKPLIPSSDDHAQRTSTSTQSLVSSREFRTDESGGGNDLDQLNEDLEDDDSDRHQRSRSR